jgi:hypothetical protein
MATNSSDFRLYEIADGAGGYPAEWHKTLKHLVREIAGHRCVRCKHPYRCGKKRLDCGEWSACDEKCEHGGPWRFRREGSSEWLLRVGSSTPQNFTILEAQWRILTVHHIDGNKLNCRWWNLAALCQRCHLTIQGRVKLNRPWLLDHSEWFRPYVAGYYAATLLGEELDRDETMSRLDELLEVGRTGKAVEIGGGK